jgi:predicted acylesterase/phospholipase RssA
MATGIVLGGGGSLGDFQVGALRFLYEKGILSDITCACGTSIGAINAVIVSTGEGCDERLEKYWSENVLDRVDLIPQHLWSENVNEDLQEFTKAEKRDALKSLSRLFTSFLPLLKSLSKFVPKPRPPQARQTGGLLSLAVGLGFSVVEGALGVGTAVLRGAVEIPLRVIEEAPTLLQEARKIPLQDIMHEVTDLSQNVEAISETAITDSALYSAKMLRKRLEERKETIELALKDKIPFCLYATDVETGQKTCFTNNRKLVGLVGDTCYVQCHSPTMLIEAALASAAVPVIFPPVAVKFEHGEECGTYYMDGGVREIVPVKGAIDCEADEIYAILCSPRFFKKKNGTLVKQKYARLNLKDEKGKIVSSDWHTSSLLDIQPEDWVKNNRNWNPTSEECDVLDVANRTAAILLDEMTKDDLIPTDATGNVAKTASGKPIETTVIDPLIPVHGWTKLNIGLLKINADQGYMRAFDVICAKDAPLEEQCEELTAEITARRIKIWALEHHLIAEVSKLGYENVDTVREMFRSIRKMKGDLKTCVDGRLKTVGDSPLSAADKKRCLPDDYVSMYMCWEPHNWTVKEEEEEEDPPKPLGPTPWDKLDLREFGSDVIEEDWSLGRPPDDCKSRSLLRFRKKSRKAVVP